VGKSEDIINACAKTPETLWEKQEKATIYNVIIVTMKKPCGKKSRTDMILQRHCLVKTYCEKTV
jgi:hypothetical protein